MLAEIFMLRLEAVARVAANSRFVPITLPAPAARRNAQSLAPRLDPLRVSAAGLPRHRRARAVNRPSTISLPTFAFVQS